MRVPAPLGAVPPASNIATPCKPPVIPAKAGIQKAADAGALLSESGFIGFVGFSGFRLAQSALWR